jgi:hypothetical protein
MVLEDEASYDKVWVFPLSAVCLQAERLNMFDDAGALCLLSWHLVVCGRRGWVEYRRRRCLGVWGKWDLRRGRSSALHTRTRGVGARGQQSEQTPTCSFRLSTLELVAAVINRMPQDKPMRLSVATTHTHDFMYLTTVLKRFELSSRHLAVDSACR